MKGLQFIVPAAVTAGLTAGCIFLASWLVGLVPGGAWSELIKAGIVIFVVGSTLLVIAWSAYFTYIVKKSLGA